MRCLIPCRLVAYLPLQPVQTCDVLLYPPCCAMPCHAMPSHAPLCHVDVVCWHVSLQGRDGVSQVIQLLKDELELSMQLAGRMACRDAGQMQADDVWLKHGKHARCVMWMHTSCAVKCL